MKKKRNYLFATIFLVITLVVFNYYQKIFGPSVFKEQVLFITAENSFLEVSDQIGKITNSPGAFLWVAAKKNFRNPKAGRYVLEQGMSNNDLVNMFRSGRQTPFKLSFNNQDTLEKLAGRIAEQIAADSTALLLSFKEEHFLSKNNFTTKSILQIFIPNTYEFYWTVSPEKFKQKMFSSYQQFWNPSRIEKAKKLNLTTEEVTILASIVQKETAQNTERPIVAGLYLNRLKRGWPLQADPTVIYCIKEKKGQDYVVKRVLTVDLEINSPYNTYIHRGLPPTLIAMPDISSIDGVLNAQKHNYLYMCANVDKLGYHVFAKSLVQHNKNAIKYHNWMNKLRINR
ncbi:MAG: endolytic transglycosylase MltG [Polaribacter sp.]